MNIDFLGVQPENAVVAEEVEQLANIIIAKRGFFFSDTVELYDADGNVMDKNGYNFDLPIPDMSARIGRMVFGRILTNGNVVPATMDYRTPYPEDDNRVEDIVDYTAYYGYKASIDYYSHAAGICKSGINEIDGAEIREWLEALDYTIASWRERNLDYDLILDKIDYVFTRGIVRYPQQFNLEEYISTTFVTTTEGGNGMDLSKWVAKWTIGTNTFEVDYGVSRQELSDSIISLSKQMEGKFVGDISVLNAKVTERDSTFKPEVPPVKSLGLTDESDISIIDNDFVIKGMPLPSWYAGLNTTIDDVSVLMSDIGLLIPKFDMVDDEAVYSMSESVLPKLMAGYTYGTIHLHADGVVGIDGEYLLGYLTPDKINSLLLDKKISGTPTNTSGYNLIKSKVNSLAVSPDEVVSVNSKYSHLGTSVSSILDGMCVTKSELNPSVSDIFPIGGLL